MTSMDDKRHPESQAGSLAERSWAELLLRRDSLEERAKAVMVKAEREVQTRRETRRGGVTFLRVELHAALMFAAMAQSAEPHEKRDRNVHNARQGYNALVRFRGLVKLNRDESAQIDGGLNKLRNALQRLGEQV